MSNRGGFRRSFFGGRSSVHPRVMRYQDHVSLQAPSTLVKFHDSKSAARVVYNQSSQLVIEENYDAETGKRQVTIKQIPEEAAGSLRIIRFTYTIMAAFFLGFLFVFTMQVIVFVALDMAICLGLTDVEVHKGPTAAFGILFSFPLFIHGFALLMMLAGIYVKDLWKGHPLFRKFVCPNQNAEAIEWVFVLGLLVFPWCVMGITLLLQTEQWWEITLLYWFFTVFCTYTLFVFSVLVYEARIFLRVVAGIASLEDLATFGGGVKACILLKQRNFIGGYTYTDYMSFGSPDHVALSSDSRKYIVEGTLSDNKRGIYTRFTQWSLLQGWMYKKLDVPQRLFSVDDITGNRPYITSYSWGLEKYFCRPRKTRYIGILKGPGAMTRRQVKSTIVCTAIGTFMVYFLLAAVMAYFGFRWGWISLVVVIVAAISAPIFLGPYRQYKELVRLKVLKEENKLRTAIIQQKTNSHRELASTGSVGKVLSSVLEETDSKPDQECRFRVSVLGEGSVRVATIAFGAGDGGEVESERTDDKHQEEQGKPFVILADEVKENDLTHKEQTSTEYDNLSNAKAFDNAVEWTNFTSNDEGASIGVFGVTERYRVTEPTDGFSIFLAFAVIVLFGLYPTASLYFIESWQLATVYLALAFVVLVRHQTNAEILIEEKGHLVMPDDDDADELSRWNSQSRLSQVAAIISRGKSYHAWKLIYVVSTMVLLVFAIQAVHANTESTTYGNVHLVPSHYYPSQNSLLYTSCEMKRNIDGHLAVSLADYMFLSALVYRKPSLSTQGVNAWYGEGVLTDRTDIVTNFRMSNNDSVPVYYRLYTAKMHGRTYAAVVVRGTHNAWDMFTDLQLWGAAALLQMVRSLLPFGWIWDPIYDQMITILSTLQTGSIQRIAFYKSTTSFVNYLVDSGNYTSVTIVGHSLGGGLAIITGAQAGVQAVGISGPNALMSRHRFGITHENLERYTFNVKPDRDLIPMIDDPAKSLQRLECRAAQNNVMSCHSIIRSLCETLYMCGTGRRPAVCECTTRFGYPPPNPGPNSTLTFEELCAGTGLAHG